MEQRVFVEIGIVGQPLGGRPVAEDGPDGRREDLAEVEVDRPHGAMEVDLQVEEEARAQEPLQCRNARFEERQAAGPDVRVASQPLDVDPDPDAREERVTANVVEVVDREDP